MEEHGLRQRDLLDVFGSRGIASEVVSGKRARACRPLLARKLPAIIRTEEGNERLIGELEQMDQRHDELTPEEREYSELLTVLIEAFEDANYALDGSTDLSASGDPDRGAPTTARRRERMAQRRHNGRPGRAAQQCGTPSSLS
jgi:antitoxin component HigA of HigAB toxin-antitoxin module